MRFSLANCKGERAKLEQQLLDLTERLEIAREPKLEDILNAEEIKIERERRKEIEKELKLRDASQNKVTEEIETLRNRIDHLERELSDRAEQFEHDREKWREQESSYVAQIQSLTLQIQNIKNPQMDSKEAEEKRQLCDLSHF
jgi:seryl-tRNA synthetase